MSPVLIECPASGEIVTTGVMVNSLDELPAMNRLVNCPSCGGAHDWTPAEATLAAPINPD